jgi:hypothetical protein
VRIEIALPGRELIVTREPIADLQGALAGAFETARRRLKGFAERHRFG